MMQNFGLEDLPHVQSRRNLLRYLVRVEMASDRFTRIYPSILAEQIIPPKSRYGVLFFSPQLIRNENQTKVNTVFIGTNFGNI